MLPPAVVREPAPPKSQRFTNTKPFSHIFCDNKKYPGDVRGDKRVIFALIDYHSRAIFAVDVTNKKNNSAAFRSIIALNGGHKLPYSCTVFTDGDGAMAPVRAAANDLGINHVYTPPHMQSLNECEKVFDATFACARALMEHSKAPCRLFNFAFHHAMYLHNRLARTVPPYITPYEAIRGQQPYIGNLVPFYSLAYVHIPKSKRLEFERQGKFAKAEPGRFLGFQQPFSTTAAVMLPKTAECTLSLLLVMPQTIAMPLLCCWCMLPPPLSHPPMSQVEFAQ